MKNGNRLMALVVLVMSTPSWGNDLDACQFSNGSAMHPKTCEVLRKKAAEQSAEKERQQEIRRQYEARESARAQSEAAARALAQAEQGERKAKWEADQREREREIARENAAQDAAIKKSQAQAAVRKKECGADYQTPSVGMTLERAKYCVGNLRLQGQTNRSDGVVSTFIGGRTYIHVMDNRVIAWGR